MITSFNSFDWPEFESARIQSFLEIDPRSPWLASVGCTNWEGVPVDEKVADILFWGAEEPDTYIDITDSIIQKITSLEKHASQVGSDIGKYLKDSSMRTAAKWESKDSSVVYAEGFRRVQIRRWSFISGLDFFAQSIWLHFPR